jgi:hypothetical protein
LGGGWGKRSARPARFAAIAGGLALALTVGTVATAVGISSSGTLLVAISSTLLAPIVWKVATKRVDVFEPIYLFAAGWAAMFVVRPAAMLSAGDFRYARVTRVIDVRDSFDKMLVLALVGAAAYVLGYSLPVGRHIASSMPAPPRKFSRETLIASSLGLVAVSAGIFVLSLYFTVGFTGARQLLEGRSLAGTRVVRATTSYLSLSPMLLVPACLVLFAVARERRSVAAAGLATLAWAFFLILTIPVGDRTTLLPLFGGAVVYFYLSRDARPRLAAVFLLLALALFGSSLVLTTRNAGPDEPSLAESALQLVRQPLTIFDPVTRGNDAEMAPTLAAALQIIPDEIPYMYGRAVVGDLLTRPVPRIAWHGKPLPPREQVVQKLWPAEYAAKIANPEFSVLLTLFLDGGVIGVAVGMALFGIASRTGYEFAMSHRQNMLVRAAYALALPFMIGGVRDAPVDTFTRMAIMVLPLLLIFLASATRAGHRRVGGLPV